MYFRYAVPFEEIRPLIMDSANSKLALYYKDAIVSHGLGLACHTTVAWRSNSPALGSFALPKNSPYTEFFKIQV